MHKFFTHEIEGPNAILRGEDHRHLSRVLRLKSGDEVLVNDENGQDY